MSKPGARGRPNEALNDLAHLGTVVAVVDRSAQLAAIDGHERPEMP